MGGFNLILREIGDCYDGSIAILKLEIRQSRGHGAWEVEIIDHEQRRSICNQYDDEPGARVAAEAAYTYGRQFGRWKIQRSTDYQPQGGPVSAVGWDPAPAHVDG